MTLPVCLAAIALLAVSAYAAGSPLIHPVYPSGLSAEQARGLAAELSRYVGMPEAALRALVPAQSGLYFCGCPNCEGGTQEGNMTWSPSDPDHLRCKSCGRVYPSADYPMDHGIRVQAASGEEHVYPYYEDAKGQRYFFAARIAYAKIHYYDGVARRLAQVYDATKDERYARAAAVLLDQYARVVPNYVPKFDYPFRPKRFFGAEVKPPYPVTPYRASRYSWWAYMDIPDELVLAYDLIADSPALDAGTRARIENDLIRGSVAWVSLNPESLSNMSPAVWRSMVRAGRVIGEPDYLHDVIARAARLLQEQFFYDAFWREGTPSYHLQTVNWLQGVLDDMRGYSDPPGYVSPRDGLHYQHLDPESLLPDLARARAAAAAMRLPDGRYAPVHDTWSTHKDEPIAASAPHLLPAMGYAILGAGVGEEQVQAHLAFSGGYGHEHADNLSALLWANGRETFSDLGYTHTKDREWTLVTASHNTVLIDQREQRAGKESDGNLLLWAEGSLFSAVEADGSAAYPQASTYRRLLALVARPEGLPFVVDIFRVAGGDVHDWFLHGNADEDAEVRLSVPTQPAGSLVPAGCTFLRSENEGDFRMTGQKESPGLYGFLREVRRGTTDAAWQADFPNSDGSATRLIVAGAPGTEVFQGRDPSVRRAKEDDAKLDQFTRPFVMARRHAPGKQSVFVAVFDPAAAQAERAVTEVTPLLIDDTAAVLHIATPDATFLIAACTDPAPRVTCDSPEGAVAFQGRCAVVRRSGASAAAQLAGAAEISWGGLAFSGPGRLQGQVLGVTPDALEVATGAADVDHLAGLTALVTHGDGTTHGYQITGAERVAPGRVKLVVPATGFTYDAAEKMTRFISFPQREIPGENRFSIDLIGDTERSAK